MTNSCDTQVTHVPMGQWRFLRGRVMLLSRLRRSFATMGILMILSDMQSMEWNHHIIHAMTSCCLQRTYTNRRCLWKDTDDTTPAIEKTQADANSGLRYSTFALGFLPFAQGNGNVFSRTFRETSTLRETLLSLISKWAWVRIQYPWIR